MTLAILGVFLMTLRTREPAVFVPKAVCIGTPPGFRKEPLR